MRKLFRENSDDAFRPSRTERLRDKLMSWDTWLTWICGVGICVSALASLLVGAMSGAAPVVFLGPVVHLAESKVVFYATLGVNLLITVGLAAGLLLLMPRLRRRRKPEHP